MTNSELLIAVKENMGISAETTNLDNSLLLKIKGVKSYMQGAGVSAEILENDLAVDVILLGVTDIWTITPGEAKFSMIFIQSVNQLSARSII